MDKGYLFDPNEKLLLYMNEYSGSTVYDSSGNNNNGTISGATWTTGKFQSGLHFNGTSAYVNLGNPATLQITGSQTISMWVKPTDFAVRQNPYNKAYGGEGTITIETDGTVNYYYGTKGGNDVPYQGFNTASSLTAGEWNHIAIVRDLGAMQLRWYINGVLTNTAAASYAAAAVSSNNVTIGYGYAGYFKGQIDHVRVVARALNATEVKQSMGELCDTFEGRTNSDTWMAQKTCNTTCDGWAPYCGDGTEDVGFETCDFNKSYTTTQLCTKKHGAYTFYPGSTASCNTSCGVSGTCLFCGDGVSTSTSNLVIDMKLNGNLVNDVGTNGTGYGTLSYVTGKYSNGVYLSSASTGISVPLASYTSFSVGAWMKADIAGTNVPILVKGNKHSGTCYDTFNNAMWLNSDGTVSFVFHPECANGDGCGAQSTSSIVGSTWKYVVGTFDNLSKRMRIYVDGVLETESICTTKTPPTSTGTLTVGYYRDNQYSRFKGSLDEIKVYSRALTSQEIVQNMANERCDASSDNGSCASSCSSTCQPQTIDTCGNGSLCLDRGEVCDGSNLNGKTCATQTSYTSGTLTCGVGCTSFNTSQCYTCGNGTVQGPEVCDTNGPNLNGKTCETYGTTPAVDEYFYYTGGQQTWVVPAGVTSVTIEAWGAQGGVYSSATPGYGGYAKGTLAVTQGQILYIYVGGQGSGGNTPGGFNGGGSSGNYGGSGGGASDVRYGGSALTNRKIVAGGGGGTGFSSTVGGNGGGSSGSAGGAGSCGTGGGGGTQTSGGVVGGCSGGQNGSSGQGGNSSAGGGGGGGYYGGASGQSASTDSGGGGGSGYIGGVTGGTMSNGVRSGHGQVRITAPGIQMFDAGTLKCAAGCLGYDTSECSKCGNSIIEGFAGETCDLGASNNDSGVSGGASTCWTNCTKWNPKGSHDGATTTLIRGWGCDEDAPSTHMTLHVYFYNKNGTKIYVKGINTGDSRVDVQSAGHCTAISTHGWSFNPQTDVALWTQLYADRANRPFTVRPYGINIPGTSPAHNPSFGDKTIGGYCGDGVIQSEFSEACESGTAHCRKDCNSVGVCGDNIVDFGEVCDGTNFGGKTCITQGFDGGSLSCSSCGSINTSGCWNYPNPVTIGTGTSYQLAPIGTYYNYVQSRTIYTAAEIGRTGTISKIAWDIATTQSTRSATVNIYLKTTTATTASTSLLTTGMTHVFSGTYLPNTAGWRDFTLSTPFNYSSGNLEVFVETNISGYVNGGYTRYTTTGTYMFASGNSDSGWPSISQSTARPNVRLTFQ
jgi:hypothetical protein